MSVTIRCIATFDTVSDGQGACQNWDNNKYCTAYPYTSGFGNGTNGNQSGVNQAKACMPTLPEHKCGDYITVRAVPCTTCKKGICASIKGDALTVQICDAGPDKSVACGNYTSVCHPKESPAHKILDLSYSTGYAITPKYMSMGTLLVDMDV